jgi:hypothetical protein
MSEAQEVFESNSAKIVTRLKILRNRKSVAILVVVLLLSTGGGIYAFLYSSAKSQFSSGCINEMSGISESFRNYQNSTHKPSLFGDSSSTPSSYNSALSSGIADFRRVAEESGIYPGAKNALEELQLYTAKLSEYQVVKGKILGIELNNPAKSDIEAWNYLAKLNAFRLAIDPAFSKRLEALGYQSERKWDSYMASKVSKSEYIRLDGIARVADGHFFKISELCRNARK